ncbi:hypothetical protein I7I50_04307 [Histoplasma capsulatum G186AR]|uniref:Uncharacterized protein n=1 Tax=Ajellomyces capsulatus TaxID=5037 RepID=A0A8H7YK02_AJECA|nr:hypothetical protein I7I52_05215 [Histoplasma capsulatum]QSS75236.1 hypothetical protein I7I50_04307 [Histoplasma capsulatum G186AR]
MVLAGPDAMGAPTKDLSWLSANVVFANSRIQPIFKSTSLPSAVIWAKEILLLRTAFNFQNRLSRGLLVIVHELFFYFIIGYTLWGVTTDCKVLL